MYEARQGRNSSIVYLLCKPRPRARAKRSHHPHFCLGPSTGLADRSTTRCRLKRASIQKKARGASMVMSMEPAEKRGITLQIKTAKNPARSLGNSLRAKRKTNLAAH